MNLHQSRTKTARGIAPLLIVIIIAAVLAAAGGGYVVATKTSFGRKLIAKIAPSAAITEPATESGQPAAAEEAGGVDSIEVTAPSFDFSFSPVPSLNASAFNVGSPTVKSVSGAFTGLSFDTDLTVDTALDVDLPEINADDIKPKTLAQPETPPASEPPAAEPPSGGQGTTVNQTNCAQFANMPGAQYCAQVGDANGRALCEQCKAAGY